MSRNSFRKLLSLADRDSNRSSSLTPTPNQPPYYQYQQNVPARKPAPPQTLIDSPRQAQQQQWHGSGVDFIVNGMADMTTRNDSAMVRRPVAQSPASYGHQGQTMPPPLPHRSQAAPQSPQSIPETPPQAANVTSGPNIANAAEGPQYLPEATDGTPARPKILCLDGGGLREQRGYDVEPWQEFDMIVGTSTGGLLAIMLGRLRMSVAQCKQAYSKLMGKVFERTRHDWNVVGRSIDVVAAKGKFSTKALEEGILDILKQQGYDKESLMLDNNTDTRSCKVMVCAVNSSGKPTFLRSYKNPRRPVDLLHVCQIWQAARATSAASTFFDPIIIGEDNREFTDGGLRYNNPVNAAYGEAQDMFTDAESDAIFVSMGTGVEAPLRGMNANINTLKNAIINIVTETEQKYQEFVDSHRGMVNSDRFFRFNVEQGLASIGLDEHEHRGDIVNFTEDYCNKHNNIREFGKCARVLQEGGQRLFLVGGDPLAAWRVKEATGALDAGQCGVCQTGFKYNTRVYYCQLCQRDLCAICQSQHLWDHRTSIVGVNHVMWQGNDPKIADEAICDHCQSSRKSRIECLICSYALCLSCGEATLKPRETHWAKHAAEGHREYIIVLAPTRRIKLSRTGPHSRYGQFDIVSLCDCCNRIVRMGDSTVECITCESEYGTNTGVCLDCYSEVAAHHPAHHRFRQYRWATRWFSDTDEEQNKIPTQCDDCGATFTGIAPHEHRHTNYTIFLGPMIWECQRLKVTATCLGERNMLLDRPLKQNPISKANCVYCTREIAWDEQGCFLCFTCFEVVCSDCSREWIVGHRHTVHPTVFRKVQLTSDFTTKLWCDGCGKEYLAQSFVGFRCLGCENRDYCFACVEKAKKGDQSGFRNGVHACKVKQPLWTFWRN